IGRTSPDAVTVCFSSGLTSSFTVTTSGSSLRVATTLMTTTASTTTATTTPIIIFFLRLNAILSFLLPGGLQNLEDVSTWKLIKQFHRRANAKVPILLTLPVSYFADLRGDTAVLGGVLVWISLCN